MIKLGIKNKDMYPKSEEPKRDYENEVMYPEIMVSGKMAEKMGAADLNEGDCVKTCVVLCVKRHTKTTTDGKTEYSMTLCVKEMDDLEPADSDDADLEGEELPQVNAMHALGAGYDDETE